MKKIGSYRALFAHIDPKRREQLIDGLANYRRIDALFFLLIVALTTFGLIILYSSGIIQSYLDSADGSLQSLINKQLTLSIIGVVGGLFIAFFINVKWLNKRFFMFIAYLFTTFLLLAVPLFGRTINGARRWLTLAGIDFQPSEIAKFMTVFVLAIYFSWAKHLYPLNALNKRDNTRRRERTYTIIYIIIPALAIGLWLGLVVMQPHLSGAIVIFVLALSMFLVAGIPAKLWLRGLVRLLPIILVIIFLAALLLPIVKGVSLASFIENHFTHVKTRTEIFTSDGSKQDDSNYQVIQSRLALGAGGLYGVGLGNSRQKYNYLPAIHNDYIFSGIGEELGFIGCTAILLLFIFLFLRGVRISLCSNSLFAALIAWGFTFLLTLQALLNMAVAVEVIPATGISLPFFSYGGTANIVFLVEAGMVLAVSRTAQKHSDIMKQVLAGNFMD